MFRYLQFVGLSATTVLVAGVLFAAGPVFADGVAVFASLTNESGTEQVRAKLIAALDVSVESSQVDINGTTWVRLHSTIMAESAARALVTRAQRSGYSAWYNGTGGSLVSSSSAAAGRAATRPATSGALVDQALWSREPTQPLRDSSRSDYGIVTPATGDISHLPLAETFPDTGPRSN